MGLKDSGDRTEQHNGATRDRAPDRSRQDLLSPFFWEELGVHAGRGAEKYSHRNWERGYDLAGVLESAERHLTSLKAGQDDEDHAIAAAWNLMAFVHIRRLVQDGLLPEILAEGFVPLHVVNPITGNVDHGDGPEQPAAVAAEPRTASFVSFDDNGRMVVEARTYAGEDRCARCRTPRLVHGRSEGCTFVGAGTESKCTACGCEIRWTGSAWADNHPGESRFCGSSTTPDVAHVAGDLR